MDGLASTPDTIRDMTAALGRLLQNISKGSDKISIYEEMSLLDDYVLIQDIKYNGQLKVNYHIGDPTITQASILKFLLQPIVKTPFSTESNQKVRMAGRLIFI